MRENPKINNIYNIIHNYKRVSYAAGYLDGIQINYNPTSGFKYILRGLKVHSYFSHSNYEIYG